MKNIKNNQLKKAIFITLEEFEELVSELTEDLYQVKYEDGIYFNITDKADWGKVYYRGNFIKDPYEYFDKNILNIIGEYFGVNVTTVHSDNSDVIGVWIVYND